MRVLVCDHIEWILFGGANRFTQCISKKNHFKFSSGDFFVDRSIRPKAKYPSSTHHCESGSYSYSVNLLGSNSAMRIFIRSIDIGRVSVCHSYIYSLTYIWCYEYYVLVGVCELIIIFTSESATFRFNKLQWFKNITSYRVYIYIYTYSFLARFPRNAACRAATQIKQQKLFIYYSTVCALH